MPCVPTNTATELEFVKSLTGRVKTGACRGPMVHLALWPWRVYNLERVFDRKSASDVLWSGFVSDGYVGIHYNLCAAHWFDLVAFAAARAVLHQRGDWMAEAQELLDDVCFTVGWDAKEIQNMFTWQRVRLT